MASVTIEKRSTWAQHIQIDVVTLQKLGLPNEWFVDYYGEPPHPSNRPWEPWTGGVFIHYMGSLLPFSPDSEYHCRAEIAQIWKDHAIDQNVGDIEYNFLVCPHGTIYEGRGYERGEANGGRTINVGGREIGRNTGFYSIQGMLGRFDEPTAAMLTSMRKLIYHLRHELAAHREAGNLIHPHSADDFPTECPGTHLTRYAKKGSAIDPNPPQSGGGGTTPSPGGPQLRIISRSNWGARPPREVAKVPASERTGFVVHYSAGPPSQTVRAIQNYHMDSNGWWDIGYNFLVDQGGRIYEGRGWDNEGAHTRGYNRSHLAVCFIGRDGDATAAAKRAIRSLYEKTNQVVGRTLSTTCHSALDSTQCPGNDLRSWVRSGMPVDGLSDVVGGGESGTPGGTRSVTSQQQAVNGLGHTPALTVDGVFGPKTEAGVKWLQTKVGTDADGVWGPNTEAAYRAYIGTGTSSNGLTSIRSAASQQRAVNGLGHKPELVVDGAFGPKTEAGVKWLQTKVGVTADGLWGPGTEAAYNDHTGGEATYSDGGLTTIRSVTYQQNAVNGLGHTPALSVDGIFGPNTEAGVKWLQTKVGVTADGLWGPDTDAAYGRYHDGARLTVDGEFGTRTIAATQQAIGVTADGVWGSESKRALQEHLNTWADAGLIVDGDIASATVKALQKHLNSMTGAGLVADGDWGKATTRALQTALNQGRF
ncbi:peptidoglycan-binding protein [Streptomyces sp. AS02]|uniref:peptidoglycan recognition protein family protein n=1 Tax=Streptomyces sp. AS02 TaxID=2938946 RepID=UPI00202277E2|nr:peptidoglycan-binding protein [Streptomyces sp. AS02]MCL8011706.1 peptidoglycan-binding protein [Streptomyces sp. AS02]